VGDVDVIVVAYRSGVTLKRCIEALLSDPSVACISVVDNSPEDLSAAKLVEGFSGVLYSSCKNIGFGPGVNSVRDCGQSDVVSIVNPDAYVSSTALSECAAFLAGRPFVGVVSPTVCSLSGHVQLVSEKELSLVRVIGHTLGLRGRWAIARSGLHHLGTHRTENLNGACLVARRSALNTVGWFDNHTFLFGEDASLCRRMRAAGFEVWYVRTAEPVLHEDGHSWKQMGAGAREAFRLARREQLNEVTGSFGMGIYDALISIKGLLTRFRARRLGKLHYHERNRSGAT
jgi:N-acetylglucosaminyl-diphospho-decaprenol L-rhamnosyltransferase